jgi:glycosyltransferase involved in cell wall biosynthesis
MEVSGKAAARLPGIRILSIMEAEVLTGPAKNLLELGRRGQPEIELSVAGYQREGKAENGFLKVARAEGFPALVIPESGRFDRGVYGRLQQLLDTARPDIVQTHNVKSHFLLRSSGLWRRYRWLAFHHGYTTTDLKMRMYNQLDRWSLRAACHVVTVCGPFRKQLEQRGIPASGITVRHNAVHPFEAGEPGEVAALRESLGIGREMPVLLMVGRLSHEKGHRDLLEAMRLQQLGRVCRLVILGEGPERHRIESDVERLGLRGSVILAGHQTMIRNYLSLASVFVMPSHSEGSPNAMLEAMAAGLPVVASRVGGIPELVEDGETALLVRPSSPAELGAALERCLRNADWAKGMGQRAKVAAGLLSYDRFLAGMMGMYERVMALPVGARL